MRVVKIAFLIATIFLFLSMAYFPRVVFAQNIPGSYVLPSETNATIYVKNLLHNYSSLVELYSVQPGFASYASNFQLYHNSSSSFEVIILQAVPGNSSFIDLLFAHIPGNQTVVIMDYRDTFAELSTMTISGYGNIFTNIVAVNVDGKNETFGFALEILSTDMSNPIPTSDNEALYVFNQESKNLPLILPSPTISTSSSQTQTSSVSSQTNNNDWSFVGIVDALGIGIILWVLFFAYVRKKKSYSDTVKIAVEYVAGGLLIFGFLDRLESSPHSFSWFSTQAIGIYILIPTGTLVFFLGNRFLNRSVVKPKNQKAKTEPKKKGKKRTNSKDSIENKSDENRGEKTERIGASLSQTEGSPRSVVRNVDSEDTEIKNVKGSSNFDTIVDNERSKRTKIEDVEGGEDEKSSEEHK